MKGVHNQTPGTQLPQRCVGSLNISYINGVAVHTVMVEYSRGDKIVKEILQGSAELGRHCARAGIQPLMISKR